MTKSHIFLDTSSNAQTYSFLKIFSHYSQLYRKKDFYEWMFFKLIIPIWFASVDQMFSFQLFEELLEEIWKQKRRHNFNWFIIIRNLLHIREKNFFLNIQLLHHRPWSNLISQRMWLWGMIVQRWLDVPLPKTIDFWITCCLKGNTDLNEF